MILLLLLYRIIPPYAGFAAAAASPHARRRRQKTSARDFLLLFYTDDRSTGPGCCCPAVPSTQRATPAVSYHNICVCVRVVVPFISDATAADAKFDGYTVYTRCIPHVTQDTTPPEPNRVQQYSSAAVYGGTSSRLSTKIMDGAGQIIGHQNILLVVEKRSCEEGESRDGSCCLPYILGRNMSTTAAAVYCYIPKFCISSQQEGQSSVTRQ